MNEIDELKNITVNLDSATARDIVHQYLIYKYFDMAIGVLGIVALALFAAWIIKKVIKDWE